MAARSGMADIITMVREAIHDTDEEWYTDEQIQQRLDMWRIRIRREHLTHDVEHKMYFSHHKMLEGDPDTWGSGIAMYDDPDEDATAVTPDSDWNLIDGWFEFSTDQDDEYYLDAWSYRKAYHKACAYLLRDLAADPNRMTSQGRGGVYMSNYNLVQLAMMHEKEAGPNMALKVRIRG